MSKLDLIIGIDVGGTFTDLIVVNPFNGETHVGKVPSLPHSEGASVLAGLQTLSINPSQVQRLVHGTTVGTNALIERKGSKTAILTTSGFRDVIEIGRTKRMIPSLFNPLFVRPKPLVERANRFEVSERLLQDGSVELPLDSQEVTEICEQLRNADIESIAICFLHSYRNATHENNAGEVIKKELPNITVSQSSEVVPEYREFERFSTTVVNAYIQPLLDAYLEKLESSLVQASYSSGILTVASNGGIMTTKTAQKLPVQTILSGPAGGVIQSIAVAKGIHETNIITDDMGGTSTDVCLIRDMMPLISTESAVEGFPIKIPQIDIKTIGAGGGSIAWRDIDGSLRVGPKSSGANPGPACYGKGGTEATVTDANVLLNRLGPQRYLGGSIQIDSSLAKLALENLSKELNNIDILQLAEGILQIAVAKKTSAIKEISLQKGHDPRDFSLMAFGGAGPMHAAYVAKELGITKIIIPKYPGNLSALGLASCDLKHDFVSTKLIGSDVLTDTALKAEISILEAQANQKLQEEGFTSKQIYFRPSLDMRYAGQAFEINVPAKKHHLTVSKLNKLFHAQHHLIYGHSNVSGQTEIVNFRLTAFGAVPKAALQSTLSDNTVPVDLLASTFPVYFNGHFLDTPVIQRESLTQENVVHGPAIIQEFGSTTVLPPEWSLSVKPDGSLILEPR
tara:strand:- start:5184 stop:7226 length:2043 start_codon:yes stop_codon:yes gene_type:complete